ncbi:DUF4238 domain-containing protein [Pseudomonas moraviensis subsp. stanleyae]|uniref:DUF4238 domain-containing protein n=1 Tax=Pseudomonas moraviensis TaxID=321662 RepID=UPI002E37314D|nr:DUF4238 domain-containing protein [Pseudomonas moraviensis]MED7670268.1 DUF4238 domain-containing protein [Pseudomonas moraviensis subsp. stanleyae]
MPANKKHHYVPKFYLKNFSHNNLSINIYNITHNKTISQANLKSQCYKDYLYGKDDKIEKVLGGIEGAAAEILKSIIKEKEPPRPFTLEYVRLILFVLIQHSRTTSAVDAMNEMTDKFAKKLLSTNESFKQEDIDKIKISVNEPGAFSIATATSGLHIILDLHCKTLIAKKGTEFITSDNPAILYNQLFEKLSYMSAIGLACKGLQIFLPISPTKLLYYYDPACYKAGDRKSSVVYITEQRDMDNLNLLQFVNASENIYFSDAQKSRISTLKSATSLRPISKTNISTHPNWETDTHRSELWVTSKHSSKTNMSLSCIKILDKALDFIKNLSKQESHPALFVRNPQLMKLDKEFRQSLKEGTKTKNFFEFLESKET